jgi:hypothetical protein
MIKVGTGIELSEITGPEVPIPTTPKAKKRMSRPRGKVE